ncbi:putative secreted protein (Por secretion system target) [Flavobacterium limicola]|uniref:Putative secreted protein (Por secretion system target) n=1 Tax=Flavobacterium limicola TaxID=180441 RepID=A0A495RSI0_9FLAO|nr:CotH kinase family protein [Flavobacterium limicola]RKS90371.1 putative secreted protein (Por secretion system target) [Flavobacterium limicola]
MKKLYITWLHTIYKIILLIVVITSYSVTAQTFTDSNLPIIIITTDNDPNTGLPLEILDDPKVLASMKIIKRPDGTRNYLTDQNTAEFLNYSGRIGIEIRGSSTQTLPKKQYALTTLKADNTSNNNVSVLGMPSENDWILNGLGFDPSLVRDYLAYYMSRELGNYASKTEYCEVVINGNYKGLYVFQEKIKSNENRVNVLKIEATDNALPNITGGYITKADKTTGGDPVAFWMDETKFVHDLPKPENATPEQTQYIEAEFNRMQDHAYDDDLIDGYRTIIDVPSFVDFMLVNELCSNADVYQSSTFFHKDRGGKLRAGPVWDFNQSFGSTFTNSSHVDKWQFNNGNRIGPPFWSYLFDNGSFNCNLAKRWNEVKAPGKPLNKDVLITYMDNALSYISEAIPREQQRWGTLDDHDVDVNRIRTFIIDRTTWITNNIGSFTNCASVVLPPLVITKINYNPKTSTSFPVSNDLEFIGLQNISDRSVNLSGLYLRQLGLTFQFPYNSVIGANETIYLASNSATFQSKYGEVPFGQFTRNLSNKSQKIVLADADGNIIDSVEYFDSAPWPTTPDGGGTYLKLISTALDNNLASSWEATSSDALSRDSFADVSSLALYPNPIVDKLTISAAKPITEVQLYTILGYLIKDIKTNSASINVDMSSFSTGIYFIKVQNEDGFTTRKIIKK